MYVVSLILDPSLPLQCVFPMLATKKNSVSVHIVIVLNPLEPITVVSVNGALFGWTTTVPGQTTVSVIGI